MTGALAAASHVAVTTTPFSVPPALMDTLQVVILVLVAAGATMVVLTRQPARQAIALSAYGLLLALMFLAFQAPDVTLSELTVGAVALPLLLMLTLAKVGKRE
jgi:energy-converting hydrogenase B subunit D